MDTVNILLICACFIGGLALFAFLFTRRTKTLDEQQHEDEDRANW